MILFFLIMENIARKSLSESHLIELQMKTKMSVMNLLLLQYLIKKYNVICTLKAPEIYFFGTQQGSLYIFHHFLGCKLQYKYFLVLASLV